MSKKDQKAALAVVGLGLIIGGHKLASAEMGKLGFPYAVGAALLAVAFQT
ncbi:MAG: hypothetical protein WAU77_07450 [Solirubrobacteraceae bacterium]